MYICSSVDGHLDCFHILAIVNKAAINFGKVRVSFWITVFVYFRYIPRVDFLNHMVVIFSFFFWGTSVLFSVVAAPTYTPTNPAREGSSHPGQRLLLLCLRVAILTDVRWQLVVALICTSIGDAERLSTCLFTSGCLLWENACLSPLPSFYSGCLFAIELYECILYINPY